MILSYQCLVCMDEWSPESPSSRVGYVYGMINLMGKQMALYSYFLDICGKLKLLWMVICELYFHLFTVAHLLMMLNICICLVAGNPQTQDGFLYRWIDAAYCFGVSRAWIARRCCIGVSRLRYCFGVSRAWNARRYCCLGFQLSLKTWRMGLPVIP